MVKFAVKFAVERFGKLCVSEGESPSGLKAMSSEFRVNAMNGKV
jgi:hypothetical protein